MWASTLLRVRRMNRKTGRSREKNMQEDKKNIRPEKKNHEVVIKWVKMCAIHLDLQGNAKRGIGINNRETYYARVICLKV